MNKIKISILKIISKVGDDKMYSRTYGKVTFKEMVEIIESVCQKYDDSYNIVVGADSQSRDITKIVVAIAVHRVGKGGFYFYDVTKTKKITNLKQKIITETTLSLEYAQRLNETLNKNEVDCDISIHVDIGKNGSTSAVIKEIVGWVMACGFDCKIKPESYVASSIADRISK